MKKINLTFLGDLEVNSNTLNEYDNEVSEKLLDHHLSRIASVYERSKGCVCYVVGMGGQSKGVFKEILKEEGVEVIWSRSILSGAVKVFGFFVASQAGLVKVMSPDKLKTVFKVICQSSMAGIFIFDEIFEDYFLKRVTDDVLPRDFSYGIKNDPGYFFYIVDADNFESLTGMYEIVSYGKDSEFAHAM